jgi:hypothetical protein
MNRDNFPPETWVPLAFFTGVAVGAVLTYVGILLQRLVLL